MEETGRGAGKIFIHLLPVDAARSGSYALIQQPLAQFLSLMKQATLWSDGKAAKTYRITAVVGQFIYLLVGGGTTTTSGSGRPHGTRGGKRVSLSAPSWPLAPLARWTDSSGVCFQRSAVDISV